MRPEAFVSHENLPSARAPVEEEPSEESLVLAARQGCGEAFSALVERHYRRVYAVIYHICGPSEAEDLTQEVFIQVLKALPKFEFHGDAGFRTWLARIASNTAINELRRRRRTRARTGPSLDARYETASGEMAFEVADEGPGPEERLEQSETVATVWKALDALAPKHRRALVLIDIQGTEYAEAALILECPVGTLKSRIARARKAFARQYRRFAGQDPQDGRS